MDFKKIIQFVEDNKEKYFKELMAENKRKRDEKKSKKSIEK